jgi:hypothetical protein
MNKHTYTCHETNKTVTQSLPPGRFLEQDEVLQKNDLGLDAHLPAYKTKCVGKLANAEDAGAPRYYRPVAPVANKTDTHVYQKTETVTEPLPEGRFLKEGETLLSGDLYLPSGGPSEPIVECNIGSPVDFNESWYRPEPVKANRQDCEESWRFLKLGESVENGDECNIDYSHLLPINGWVSAKKFKGLCVSLEHAEGCNFRRKVSADRAVKPTPKKKYIAISGDMVIRIGDQYYSKVTRGWRNVSTGIGFPCDNWPLFRIRRPVK